MYLKTNEHGNNIKFTGYSKSHSNREVYRNIYIKKQKWSQIYNLTVHLQEMKKEQQSLILAEEENKN